MKDRKGEISKEFKLVRPLEPVINISPFYLDYDQNYLTIQTMNEVGILGLEFSFPKVISIDTERHEKFHETVNYPCRKYFDDLVIKVKERTKKAKVISPTKIFKPDFWISENSLTRINKNHYLISDGLTVN